jgi:two-component system phosphate regulon response regulator PhoB
MARILIVEDEADLAGLLVYNLQAGGIKATVAGTGAAAITSFRQARPDLVLLDLMLPDMPGLDVVRFIRDTERSSVPVIILTARGEESDRICGLELGADDYVVKPFSVKELMLRTKAVLGRAETVEAPEAAPLSAGGIHLDSVRHAVTVDGEAKTLTLLEFRLLKTFLERPERVLTRETLLADVWGFTSEPTTRTVDTHIKRLREKLGPGGEVIETVRGVGYKFVARRTPRAPHPDSPMH